MKLLEIIHSVGDRRVMPVAGDFVVAPILAVIWGSAETELVKWLSGMSVVVLLATRLLALAIQFKGAFGRLNSHNEKQDRRHSHLERWAETKGYKPPLDEELGL